MGRVITIADSLGGALSTFVAQNYGAKLYDRVKRGVRIGMIMTLSCVVATSIVLYFLNGILAKLFIGPESYDIIPKTTAIMHFVAPFYFLYVFGEGFAIVLKGVGETFRPMVITLIGTCLTRILWIVFFVPVNPQLPTILTSIIPQI